MSYREKMDEHSELFTYRTTSPKHTKHQINGQTQQSQTQIIARANAKAYRSK